MKRLLFLCLISYFRIHASVPAIKLDESCVYNISCSSGLVNINLNFIKASRVLTDLLEDLGLPKDGFGQKIGTFHVIAKDFVCNKYIILLQNCIDNDNFIESIDDIQDLINIINLADYLNVIDLVFNKLIDKFVILFNKLDENYIAQLEILEQFNINLQQIIVNKYLNVLKLKELGLLEYYSINIHNEKFVQMSHDSKFIITYPKEVQNFVNIYNTQFGKLLYTLNHGDEIVVVTISKDSKFIITGSKDNIVKIWNAQNGELIRKFTYDDYPTDLELSSDNNYMILSICDDTIWIVNFYTGKILHEIDSGDLINNIKIANNNQFFVIGCYGRALVYSIADGQLLYDLKHEDAEGEIAISNDSEFIITTSILRHSAHLFNVVTGGFIRYFHYLKVTDLDNLFKDTQFVISRAIKFYTEGEDARIVYKNDIQVCLLKLNQIYDFKLVPLKNKFYSDDGSEHIENFDFAISNDGKLCVIGICIGADLDASHCDIQIYYVTEPKELHESYIKFLCDKSRMGV